MPFAAQEVEDGTGLATALVYEQNAAVVAYLTRRLASSRFVAASDAEQQRAQIAATEAVETEVRPIIRGFQRTTGQRLIFPAVGAYDAAGRLMDDDPWSWFTAGPYVEGIRLLCEEAAAGTLLRFAGGLPVLAESSARGSATYRGSIDLTGIAASHPKAWRLISQIFPRMG